jgi:hypothetical protein
MLPGMASEEIWAQRVAEWKASGLSSPEFCKDKPFTPGGLRHMAFRLERGVKKGATVRLARLVRVPSREAQGSPGAGVMIELGRARVAVPPGVDQRTLAAVVEVLSAAATRDP